MRSSVHIASKRHRRIHGPTLCSEERRITGTRVKEVSQKELTLFPPNAAPISAPLVPTLTFEKKIKK